MNKSGGLLLLSFLLLLQTGFAQQKEFAYENRIYSPQIKTVQCYNTQKEQSVPVIALNSKEKIICSFDDLSGGSKDYWYTVEHCTYDWKPSNLSTLDYLDGLSEDKITDYSYSSKTLQKFTHYTLTLPSEQIKPKISGNYLLKVYREGDAKNPIFTQRFYITANQVNTGMEVTPSNEVALRSKNQKINFTIFHQTPIQNPYNDIKIVLMQNGNQQTAKLNTKPAYVKPGSLVYNEVNANDFPGLNEFKKFDIRSLRYKAEHVQDIFTDTANNIILFQDLNGNAQKYSKEIDDDGAFFIRNQDNRDNDTDSDYAHVLFTLNTPPPSADGDAYVVGRFNNYTLSDDNKLTYDAAKKRFYINLFLKQGVYDYQYVWKEKSTGKTDYSVFEGSFFETGNNYQAFVYFRKPGGRWDELIGYTNISTVQR